MQQNTIALSVRLWLIGFLLIVTFGCDLVHGSTPNEISERIRRRIEIGMLEQVLAVGPELVHAQIAVPLFYERRNYFPAWSTAGGVLPQVDSLLAAIDNASHHGLSPSDYHRKRIRGLVEQIHRQSAVPDSAGAGRRVDLDLLCTDAFMIYTSHLVKGRVDPTTFDPEWLTEMREADPLALLEVALAENTIGATIESLLPNHPGYRRLVAALAHYRAVQDSGGWPVIPEGPKLERGQRDDRVPLLRKRLRLSDDLLAAMVDDSLRVDSALVRAVQRFQVRNGLEPDGVIGQKTMEVLNISAAERIERIVTSLERWRWLPTTLGPRFVIVNIAGFELDVIEGDSVVLPMRVVVGKPYHRTPVFTDTLRYLVLNPYWNVPTSIAVKEILPKLKQDPGYLDAEDMELWQGYGADRTLIDPRSVDWSQLRSRYFPYWIRQRPGPKNPLGEIKFMLPNKFNIYLHDTSQRDLFARAARSFSHGCVRIEKPLDLAVYLLADSVKWNRAAIEKALTSAHDGTVILPKTVPVHILYWTAWVSPDGTVNFRPDIYDRDRALMAALREAPPTTENL